MPPRVLHALVVAALPIFAVADEGTEEEAWPSDEVEAPRLDLTLWGGQAWNAGATGARSEAYAAEATWRFDRVDLGLFAGRYDFRETTASGAVERFFAPVYLARIGQRFETRNGLLASFTFAVGTAKTASWRSWFQVALGARATYGPAFLAGELAFESEELIRLSVGIGVSLL